MELHTNSSNNTIFADASGNIAYFHGNFIPKRDTKFDWTRPVDGSDPATDWHGLMSVDESPLLLNPASGWLYNSNNSPWSAAGPSSPKKEELSGLRRFRQRVRARAPRDSRAAEQEGLHARRPRGGGVRQLSAVVREADARPDQGVRRPAGVRPAQGEARRTDRHAEDVGSALVGNVDPDVARILLGAGRAARRWRRRRRRRVR